MSAEELVFDYTQVLEHGVEPYEGTPLDVRAVISDMPQEVKDGFRLGAVPWSRFSHAYGQGDDVPALLARLRSSTDAETAEAALLHLWSSVVHQGTVASVAPLTVPFLLRIARDVTMHHRAPALALAAAAAQREHWGNGSRTVFLQVTPDGVLYDCGGYPMNWSIQASRDAIAADADLLLSLLDDADPEIRASACYTLATASNDSGRIADALRTRLVIEPSAEVRASLVLAVAQLAREHSGDAHQRAFAWTQALWADTAQPADVRVSAALAWLCLTDDVVPEALRTMLDDLVTDALARDFDRVAWIAHIDDNAGLTRTLDQMLNDAHPEAGVIDPWA